MYGHPGRRCMGTERRKLQNFQDQSEKMRLENRNFQNLMLCNRNRSVSSNYIATTPNPPSDLTGAHRVEKSRPAGSCPNGDVRNLISGSAPSSLSQIRWSLKPRGLRTSLGDFFLTRCGFPEKVLRKTIVTNVFLAEIDVV